MLTTTRAILLAILLTGSTVWILADWSRLFAVAGAGSVTASESTLTNQPQAGESPQPLAFPATARRGQKVPGKKFDVDPVVRQNARDAVVVLWVQQRKLPPGSTWGTLTRQQQIDVENEAWRRSPYDRIGTIN